MAGGAFQFRRMARSASYYYSLVLMGGTMGDNGWQRPQLRDIMSSDDSNYLKHVDLRHTAQTVLLLLLLLLAPGTPSDSRIYI